MINQVWGSHVVVPYTHAKEGVDSRIGVALSIPIGDTFYDKTDNVLLNGKFESILYKLNGSFIEAYYEG